MTSDILKGQLLELGVTEWLSNYAERRARRAARNAETSES